jgi:hypothetical protein
MKHERLEHDGPPEMLEYIYGYFQQLSETRNVGMSINAITFEEIKAFNELFRLNMQSFEDEIIKALDNSYLNHYFKSQKKKAK